MGPSMVVFRKLLEFFCCFTHPLSKVYLRLCYFVWQMFIFHQSLIVVTATSLPFSFQLVALCNQRYLGMVFVRVNLMLEIFEK